MTGKVLELVDCGIDDERLAEMVNSGEIPHDVAKLDLVWNMITDLSPLSGLTNLKVLALNDNLITDISPLAGLTKLEELYISGYENSITLEQINTLQKSLPKCNIIHSSYQCPALMAMKIKMSKAMIFSQNNIL